MPLQTSINVNTGYNPPRVIVSVKNATGGPGPTVIADVILSWDSAYEDCTDVVGPLVYNLQNGSCTWSGQPIPYDKTKLFTLVLQRIQAGATFAVATAHDATNEDWDTASVGMP